MLDLNTLWSTILTILVGLIGYMMNEKFRELARISILLNKTREEVERDIVLLLRQGHSLRETARKLGMAKSTVGAVAQRRADEIDTETWSFAPWVPSEEEIWGHRDPVTGQRQGGLVHGVQEHWTPQEERARRAHRLAPLAAVHVLARDRRRVRRERNAG